MKKSIQRVAAACIAAVGAATIVRGDESAVRVTEMLRETFTSNTRTWPNISKGDHWDATIEDDVLKWQSKQPSRLQSTRLSLPISSRRRHEISLDVRQLGGTEAGAGLQWGATPDGQRFLGMTLSPSGRFRFSRHEDGTLSVIGEGDASSVYHANEFNRIALRVFGPQTILFINGVPFWIGDTPTSYGLGLGVLIEGGVTAEFDNVVINYLRADDAVFEERLA
ncbi:MAG TPA: hypothetical protein VHF69_11585, partial [Candidatus Synoicihabitans sp.]|nr:hypothetical protein [Candidatus Synoicihabitans sp.]